MLKSRLLVLALASTLIGLSGTVYGAAPASNCNPGTSQDSPGSNLRVAITLDDLPFADKNLSLGKQQTETAKLLRALKAHDVPAIGFVNENKLLAKGEVDARIGLLRAWLNAGITLGNHGFDHLSLQKTPLHKAETAVLKGEVITRWLMKQYGTTPRYYRYPYNQTGPTRKIRAQFIAFLKRHGYTVAPFTIQNDDFVYDKVYTYDLQHGKTREAQRVKKAYVAHLPVVLKAHETMTRELFGHQIAQIFDLHADRLNADTFDTLLAMMQRRGYCFVSLTQALKDPAYDSPDGY